MSRDLILIVPSVRKGNGSGHFVRSIALAASRPERFRLYIDRNNSTGESQLINIKRFPLSENLLVSKDEVENIPWLYILLDQRQTDDALFSWLKGIAPLAGRDEFYAGGLRFDYLIESLPTLKQTEVNLRWADPELIPHNKRNGLDEKIKPERILFSFGGEDHAGLTLPSVKALMSYAAEREIELTVVTGDNSFPDDLPAEINRLIKPVNLKEKLADYDLLICSYGLTALEALYAKLPVITINPTRYHSQLAQRMHMPVAGTGKPDCKKLIAAVDNYRNIKPVSPETVFPSSHLHPAELSPEPLKCPVCGSVKGRVICRIPARTFYKCSDCTIIFQQPWIQDTTEYNRDYFFTDYSKQYGRSYLEDFEHIKAIGRKRNDSIHKLLKEDSGGKNLLDIGCAYGPFLAAATEAGFNCQGVEPAEDAAAWVRDNLRIPVFNGPLESFLRHNIQKYDVITLWYVIEHFKDLTEILPAITGLLRPGGILAFSTPNARGITAAVGKKQFFSSSPGDHYTVWSPASAEKILKQAGFGKIKFRATGIHRERFPGWMRFFWPLSRIFADKLLLGDTFEVYAVKRNDAGVEYV